MSELVRKLPSKELEDELRALEQIWGILEALEPRARSRILTWLYNKFDS